MAFPEGLGLGLSVLGEGVRVGVFYGGGVFIGVYCLLVVFLRREVDRIFLDF